MPEAALSPRTTVREDVITAAVARRTTAHANVEPTDIAANPVYQIMLAEDKSPEEKRDAVAAFLTFAGTKEESRSRVKAYQAFEEYMQAVREQMAQEIIRLTDTETFSELQAVYNDLNNALIDFDEKMRPLTEIVDAIYVLRTNDKTLDAFREIQTDRNREVETKRLGEQKEREFEAIRQRIGSLTDDIARLGERKAFFGFGNVTQAAREEIATKEIAVQEARDGLDRLQGELRALEQRGPGTSSIEEFSAQKAKLRELLDISSDTHKKRQSDLVASALNFVDTAKQRIGNVRAHLGKMNDQVDHLYDANAKMSGVYAVLTDGIKSASDANQDVRGTLTAPEGEESLIAKMAREEKNMAVEEHITALTSAGAHTTETYADLTSQTIRIKTMRDSTQNQIEKARNMGTQGVAGVADRLSVVLQAVSSAALGEASAMAKDTLSTMVANTNAIAQKETIRVAMGVSDANQDVLKAIDDLGAYGEVVRTSTDITRQGLTEMRSNLAKIKELAESVRDDVHEAVAVSANIGANKAPTASGKISTPDAFGLVR